MRTAINVALVIVSASGVVAQRRGAFIAGPPYAGRPPVPAVAGTPGAALWNPGPPATPSCCFNANPNGNWRRHSRDGDRGPQILAVPVPFVTGGDADPQPMTPEEEQPNQPAPEPRAPPITVVIQSATPAPTGGTENPAAAVPAQRCAEPAKIEPPHVLIALNNGWVYAAVAYWVDKDTLHYVTTQGDHNQVSLSLVDRKISERLNQNSRFAFILP